MQGRVSLFSIGSDACCNEKATSMANQMTSRTSQTRGKEDEGRETHTTAGQVALSTPSVSCGIMQSDC